MRLFTTQLGKSLFFFFYIRKHKSSSVVSPELPIVMLNTEEPKKIKTHKTENGDQRRQREKTGRGQDGEGVRVSEGNRTEKAEDECSESGTKMKRD